MTHRLTSILRQRLARAVLIAVATPAIVVRPGPATAATAAEVYRAAKDSVVQIVTESGLGSGFFFDDGTLIATNHHVIAGASKIEIRTSSGLEFSIERIVRADAALDLAILAVPVKGRPLTLARGVPEIGVDAFAIGSPQGLESTLSAGIISGLREDGKRRLLQFSAPISPGSSGGPVLDDQGRVLGVVSFLRVGGQNLNFAVSALDLLALSSRTTEPPVTTRSAPTMTTPSVTTSGTDGPREVIPTAVINDLGARVSIWNSSKCPVSAVSGTISFVPRPSKDAPVLYEEAFTFTGIIAPGERASLWLPIDAVAGHSEAAPLERRWYTRTTLHDYSSQCSSAE